MKKILTFIPTWICYIIAQMCLLFDRELERTYEMFGYEYKQLVPFYLFFIFATWSFSMKEWSGLKYPWYLDEHF